MSLEGVTSALTSALLTVVWIILGAMWIISGGTFLFSLYDQPVSDNLIILGGVLGIASSVFHMYFLPRMVYNHWLAFEEWRRQRYVSKNFTKTVLLRHKLSIQSRDVHHLTLRFPDFFKDTLIEALGSLNVDQSDITLMPDGTIKTTKSSKFRFCPKSEKNTTVDVTCYEHKDLFILSFSRGVATKDVIHILEICERLLALKLEEEKTNPPKKYFYF